MKSVEVARQFVARINAGDVEGIVALMSPDHKFVDSLGREILGREDMKSAWIEYYRVIPDYHIEVESALCDGALVAFFGKARGTYTPDGILREENEWTVPGAWRARIDGDTVAEWQIYIDGEPIRKCIRGESNK